MTVVIALSPDRRFRHGEPRGLPQDRRITADVGLALSRAPVSRDRDDGL